jgi:hypothetical protein
MQDVADRAIASMRSPRDMHIICVDVTNRCDLRCSNCTRLLVNQARHWDMKPDNFRAALRSLEGYKGVIAMIGGNPCLHRSFTDLCQIFVEEVPVKRQRGLWSNNVFEYQEVIRDTFGFFNLNPHNDEKCVKSMEKLKQYIPGIQYYQGHSRHAPLLTAMRDLYPDEEEMWEMIADCDINKHWSASIVESKGELRAYFCEVAASFDLARGGDHGAKVTKDWWRKSIVDYSDQVKRFCPGCGVPARLKAQVDLDEVDTYTETNADIVQKSRGKRKTVRVDTLEQTATSTRPVTDYTEQHGVPAVAAAPGVRVSVVIPCYNAADTIEETIESVLAQRVAGMVNVEIVVADDGSTDRSRANVERLARQHPGTIRFLSTPVGRTGPAAARNRGLRVITGQHVCFLDADDCYNPGFFEAAIRGFDRVPQVAAISTGVELVDAHREVPPIYLMAMAHSLPSNMMVRRGIADAIGGYPEDKAFRGKSAGEDVAFRNAVRRNFMTARLEEPLLRYRIRRGSHFDWLMDSTSVVDGAIVKTDYSDEERDGSLNAAAEAYSKLVDGRVQAVLACSRPDLVATHHLNTMADSGSFQAGMWKLSDVSAVDANALRQLAAQYPALGFIAVPERISTIIRGALQEGTRVAGRRGVVTLEELAQASQPVTVRLLALDVSVGGERWIEDLRRGLPFLAGDACVAVYLRADRGDLAGVRRALQTTGAQWDDIPSGGRIGAFRRA